MLAQMKSFRLALMRHSRSCALSWGRPGQRAPGFKRDEGSRQEGQGTRAEGRGLTRSDLA